MSPSFTLYYMHLNIIISVHISTGCVWAHVLWHTCTGQIQLSGAGFLLPPLRGLQGWNSVVRVMCQVPSLTEPSHWPQHFCLLFLVFVNCLGSIWLGARPSCSILSSLVLHPRFSSAPAGPCQLPSRFLFLLWTC